MVECYQYMPRSEPNPGSEYPLVVKYCGECSMPLEYCEFSSSPDKCRQWLEQSLPEEFEHLMANNCLSQQSPEGAPSKGRQVRGGKGSGARKPVKQKITVFKTSRGKKKYTTSVIGLSTFEIDLKSASKFFGQKFATGTSVTGNGDEIVVQGDVKDELIDILVDKWPEIDADLIEDLGEMKR